MCMVGPYSLYFNLVNSSMRTCELRSCEWQNYSIAYTYLFIIFCLVLFYTPVRYDCFRFVTFVCTFESLCLNNCKMRRSKQRTLFEFDVFAKTKKWEGTDTVVVSGTYVKRCY